MVHGRIVRCFARDRMWKGGRRSSHHCLCGRHDQTYEVASGTEQCGNMNVKVKVEQVQ